MFLQLMQTVRVLDRAFEYFCSDEKGQNTYVNREEWPLCRDLAVVEKVDRFYFPMLFDRTGNVINAGAYAGMSVYAVNINYPGYGFATIYCAPSEQIDGAENAAIDSTLCPFAYDAFKPFSEKTLFIPSFHEEDFYR